MESLVSFFVNNRLAVGIFTFMVALFGAISYVGMPREAAPDLKIPVVLVAVPYPGVSPVDIETLIVNEIESELKDLKGVKVMRSTAAEGAAIISIEFNPDVDVEEAVRKTRERVDRVKPDLPADALEPDVKEVSFEDFPIITVNIAAGYSLVKLKAVAEDLQDDLEDIDGVLEVKLGGGLEREIQVLVDPARLALHGIGIGELQSAIGMENINLPGGSVESGSSSFLVRVPGELKTASDIENIVVKSRGQGQKVNLTVGEIANVIDSFKERSSLSRIGRTESVSLNVTKRAGSNLIRISDDVKRIVAEKTKTLPPGTRVTLLADQSKMIRDMVSDLQNNILSGLILILAILPLFLTIRSSIIVGTAIPLSFMLTMIVLDMQGITLNMIVLFSLILSLGMLVDNSIVVVENTYRLMSGGMSRPRAAVMGAVEVAWPVIASTATTCAAFLPLIFWPGIMGKFMGYLPRTLIITLLSSLFVALFINPVMCALFLSVSDKHSADESTEPTGWIYRKYRTTLQFALKRWYVTLPGVFVALVFTMGLYGSMNLGVQFFPENTPDTVTIEVRAADGSHLDATDSIVNRIESVLDGDQHIKNFVAIVGQSGGGNVMAQSGAAPHLASIQVDFHPIESRQEPSPDTIARIRKALDAIPGAAFEVRKQDMGPPAGAPVAIEVLGDDWDTLGVVTADITEAIKGVEGLVDLKDDFNGGRPEVQIRVDREKAKLVGTGTMQIASAVRTAINGTKATSIRDGTDEFDVTVRFQEESRNRLEDLESLLLTVDQGRQVPIREVATIVTEAGAGSIRHKDRERVITISADVSDRLPNDVRLDVEGIVGKMKFPEGYGWRSAGENEEQKAAQAFLLRAFMIAALMILMIIVLQFNSLFTPLIIMTSVVLSTIGVFWGLIIFQKPFGVIMTGLGVISLAGVAVNNAIVLIDFINKRRAELAPDQRQEAITQAGVIRLRPVLLTAITTVLGLAPMVFGVTIDFFKGSITVGGRSAEMWSSMAIAVAFGLIFTTFLTLVVVPVLYDLAARISGFFSGMFGHAPTDGEPRATAPASPESSTGVPTTPGD
jgi:multidrug efflux pump subunit AcrB